ncbi:MAG TPA: hypothetical protein PKO15_15470 [Fibrobacteria bacterium]|nr:hypothetical protein [Fibrobacteria bacterium]
MILTFLIDLIRKLRIPILLLLLAGGGWYVRGCWRASSTQSTLGDLVARGGFDSAWLVKREAGSSLDACHRQQATLSIARFDERADTAIFRALDTLKQSCWYPADSTLEFGAMGNLRIASHARLDTSDRWKVYASAFRIASECVKTDSTHRSCWLMGFQALEAMRDTFSTRSWAGMARKRWPTDSSFANLQALAMAMEGKMDSAHPLLNRSCPDSLRGAQAIELCRRARALLSVR